MGFSFLLLKKLPFIPVFLNQPDYDVKKKGLVLIFIRTLFLQYPCLLSMLKLSVYIQRNDE